MEISAQILVGQYYRLTTDIYIHAFTYFVIIDILTGLLRSWKEHKLNSTVSLWGLIKHFLVALLIITMYPYLIYIKFTGIAYSIVMFFIATYVISVIENLDALGIKFPSWVRKRFEKIKKDLDDKEG